MSGGTSWSAVRTIAKNLERGAAGFLARFWPVLGPSWGQGRYAVAVELFGELSLFQEDDRKEFAEAIESSTVVMIPKTAMLALMARHPNLNVGITKLIGSRRQRIERRLRNLLFRSNRERVVHLLIEMSEKYGQRTEQGLELCIKLSHQEMASIIGSTRETVTVMLGQLQSEGLIKIARRRITIVDLNRLSLQVSEPIKEVENRVTNQDAPQPRMEKSFQ